MLHLSETINRKIIFQGTLMSDWMAVQKLSQLKHFLLFIQFYSASIGNASPNNLGHFSVRRSQALDPLVPFLHSSVVCVCVSDGKVIKCGSVVKSSEFVRWQHSNRIWFNNLKKKCHYEGRWGQNKTLGHDTFNEGAWETSCCLSYSKHWYIFPPLHKTCLQLTETMTVSCS